MISVLCIGMYNGDGVFTKKQWEHFLEWCKTKCNKVVIYSRMSYDTICSKFSDFCKINVLEKPDEALDVQSYEISIVNTSFWSYIKNYNYDINVSNDISHMYFFDNNIHIASLEIVDYENYIFLEETSKNKCDLILDKELIMENYRLCLEGKADIEGFLQKESWKPLGEN